MGNRKLKINNNNSLKLNMQNLHDEKTTMTIEEFFTTHEKFMKDKALEGLASRTLEEHRTHLKYFKYYLEADKRSIVNRIADVELNYNIFKDYLAYMVLEKQYKPCTVNLRLRTIKCYLKWLYENNYIDEDFGAKLKLVKVMEDTIKPLSDTEITKMLKACDLETYAGYRDYTIMLLMLDCGIRVGETAELKVDDIDIKQRIITIRAENAKSRKVRQVPISSIVCKLVKELINIANTNKCEYVFQSTYGGKIKKQNLILSFNRISKRAGMKNSCSPHRFRHTFATNAVKANMDIFTLQRIMGHSTLLTTRKYVQLESNDLKRKHDKMNFVGKYFR